MWQTYTHKHTSPWNGILNGYRQHQRLASADFRHYRPLAVVGCAQQHRTTENLRMLSVRADRRTVGGHIVSVRCVMCPFRVSPYSLRKSAPSFLVLNSSNIIRLRIACVFMLLLSWKYYINLHFDSVSFCDNAGPNFSLKDFRISDF